MAHTPTGLTNSLSLSSNFLGTSADAAGAMTYFPNACTISTATIYSTVTAPILTLRSGTPGSMSDTNVVCSVDAANTAKACTNLPFSVSAGTFLDFGYTGGAQTSGFWTYIVCQ
jgi:hypothetical protein